MPKYTIGKTHSSIRPNVAPLGDKGLDTDFDITTMEVNKWFDEAFRKFMDDPYVELDPTSATDCARLMTLSKDEENGTLKLKPMESLTNLENMDMATKKALYQASREGHLFYFDASLGENGGMRQIYTKTEQINGKTEQELCVTDQIHHFPEAAAPKSPAFWKYIAAIFSKRYSDEIDAYRLQIALHAEVDAYIDAVGLRAEVLRKDVGNGMKREEMLKNKQERIEAYEKAKERGFENSSFKSPKEFLQELKDNAKMNEKEIFSSEFLEKGGHTVGDFCRALVKIMVVQMAKKTLMGVEKMTEQQQMEYAKKEQFGHRLVEKGLKAFVLTQLDMKFVEEKICANHIPNAIREANSYEIVKNIRENGLDNYFASLGEQAEAFKNAQKEKNLEMQKNDPEIAVPSMNIK